MCNFPHLHGLTIRAGWRMLLAALYVLASGSQATAAVECGEVLTQDTVLEADLLNCPGDGLIVGADGIVIDLGGHQLRGPRNPRLTNAGIRNEHHRGVEIRNGRIGGFRTGVVLVGASKNRIEALSDADIYLEESNHNQILGNSGDATIYLEVSNENQILGNRLDGFLDEAPITLSHSHRNRVEGNVGFNMGGFGLRMTGSHYNQLIDNEIFGDNNALVISESHHNLLKGNNIDSGFDNAIVLAGFDNRVIGNYSRGYEGGIILGGSRNLVADNRIGGGMRAVDLRGNFNRIEANTIEGGGEEEVFPAMRVRGDSNRITANQIIGWVDGFPAMDLGGNRNQVGQNVIVGDHPLVVTGDFNRIRGNRITGWDAGFPVVELGGNRNQVTGNAVVGRFPSLESCSALVGVRVTEGVGNQLARNWVTENCTDGILVDGAASETRLLRNLVAANGEDGIDVEDPTAKVSGNTALENGDYGIEGVPGVRGGGNQASGNGNPAQCLEIACN